MADFQTSTHRLTWILSQKELAQKRHAANQNAINALQKYGATRLEVQADGSLLYSGVSNGADSGNPTRTSLPEPLTVDEELLICRFYEQKIQQVCAAFSFPHKIQATAILYLKRFFLSWSIMEHDAKQIMLTCIYLSCKVEEFHVSADELGKGISQDPQFVLKNELNVLQGLRFDLIVYTPYRSLDGFISDMEDFFQVQDEVSLQALKDLREAAIFVVDSLMLTDAVLLFPPAQLALASLRNANMEAKAIDFQRYLKHLSEQHRNKPDLGECLDAIEEKLNETKPLDVSEMKRIDRKLKYCRNPQLQDESKKRDRKSKHRSKRASQEASAGDRPM